MKSARVYIVVVENKFGTKISQEGFWNYSDTIEFIKERSDCPVKISSFHYESNENKYLIHDVRIS